MSYITEQLEKAARIENVAHTAITICKNKGLTVEEAEAVPEQMKKLLQNNRSDRKEKFLLKEKAPTTAQEPRSFTPFQAELYHGHRIGTDFERRTTWKGLKI